MKKTMLLIPLFALILAVPVACAGTWHMDVQGSGNISFYSISSDRYGTIMQGYTGDRTVDYESTYNDGALETDIDSTGTGGFGTILLPKSSWSADATYTDDGTPVSDFGSGATFAMFPHSWTSSFVGGGTYTVN